ncbi:ThiF family adenylyltransferase [Candidatus Saccharibacteria bacterium]|jgi:molybdopterin/thiamine biosynthesis adenylyltransferase/N-acyl-L-homoserine lactone synthetase|nr:ThiF family adenylyltransferase [Candidatus Saccharibacteria bacterium]
MALPVTSYENSEGSHPSLSLVHSDQEHEIGSHDPYFEAVLVNPDSPEMNEVLKLRADVYIDERQFLPETHRDDRGREVPDVFDDIPSTQHYALYEQNGERHIAGTLRIIKKTTESSLPVESLFGDVVKDVAQGSVEISRLVVKEGRRAEADKLFASLILMRAALSDAVAEDSPRLYAVVEEGLLKHLRDTIGFPFEVHSGPRYIEEYESINYAISLNPKEVMSKLFETDRALKDVKGNGVLRHRPIPLGPFFKEGLEGGWAERLTFDTLLEPQSCTQAVERNRGFLSDEEIDKVRNSSVAIAGVGGDGGRLAIELARMGVSDFSLADPEDFDYENLNRQESSDYETVGTNKAVAVAQTILKINPFAKIRVYPSGVDESNIDSFMAGANLIVDETEMTIPTIGVMINRKARENGQPVLMVLNVGFGCQVTSFKPDGISFERRLGLPDGASLEEIDKMEVGLDKWLAYLPSYVDMDVYKQVDNGEISAPSMVQGVDAAASIGATEALKHLLEGENRRGKAVFAPSTIVFDAYDHMHRVVRRPALGLAMSGLKLAALNKFGRVPKVAQ